MYVGIPNPNVLIPVEKMTIKVIEGKKKGEEITVMYNPEQYVESRGVNMTKATAFGANAEESQIPSGVSETLSFTLFFDTMSSGSEVGGSMIDKAKFAANSLLPSAAKQLDVRTYTQKIYSLMQFDETIHAVPALQLSWSTLSFVGYLSKCNVTYTKFNEMGKHENAQENAFESPDTTKYRTVMQGDALWAMALKEYGEAKEWRTIAQANGLTNPRRLRTGERLVLPALD